MANAACGASLVMTAVKQSPNRSDRKRRDSGASLAMRALA
jgi:hypothetical protein